MRSFVLLSIVLMVATPPLTAQEACSPTPTVASAADPALNDARSAGLHGEAVPAPGGLTSAWLATASGCPEDADDGVRAAPAMLLGVVHGAYPVDRDNGALRGTRGIATLLSGGVEGRFGPLRFRLAPEVLLEQNREFAVLDTVFPTFLSPWSDPWNNRRMDVPVRFGEDAGARIGPGQSTVAFESGAFHLGVSTENLRIGPALWSPILLGPTAPGFPHVRLGTRRPVSTPLGRLEAMVLWGRVSESEYFDDDPDDDHRMLSGMVLTLTPAWTPGLRLGVAGLVHSSLEGGFEPGDLGHFLILPLETADANTLEENGLAALFFQWRLPAAGAEFWGEWARDDFAESVQDLLAEPGHGTAWTLGLQKILDTTPDDDRWTRLTAELSTTQSPATEQGGRSDLFFYSHGGLRQGHTHGGQLLGSFIGTDGSFQRLAVDHFSGEGMWGGYLERVRRRAVTYYRFFAPLVGPSEHDVELRAGLRRRVKWDEEWEVEVDASLGHRRNRGFVSLREGTDPVEWDPALRVRLLWRP